MVAIQSRFHRGKPDGEPFALKPLKFHLVPNLQFVTPACGSGPALESPTSLAPILIADELLRSLWERGACLGCLTEALNNR